MGTEGYILCIFLGLPARFDFVCRDEWKYTLVFSTVSHPGILYWPRRILSFSLRIYYAYENLRTLLWCNNHTKCTLFAVYRKLCQALDAQCWFYKLCSVLEIVIVDFCICSRCLIWITIKILTGFTFGGYQKFWPRYKTILPSSFDSGQYDLSQSILYKYLGKYAVIGKMWKGGKLQLLMHKSDLTPCVSL